VRGLVWELFPIPVLSLAHQSGILINRALGAFVVTGTICSSVAFHSRSGVLTDQVEHAVPSRLATAAQSRRRRAFIFISESYLGERMSQRAIVAARRMRDQLLSALGRQCVMCGCTTDLSFDCKVPQGPHHHGLSWDQRMRFYRSQARAGNIVILCRVCNGRKGGGVLPPYLPAPRAPSVGDRIKEAHVQPEKIPILAGRRI